MTGAMKAISMWQPWGSLWLSPNKRHETRHWQTKHRGRLLVHAAKKMVKDVGPDLDGILTDEFGHRWDVELPVGAVIGMVDLLDCIPTEKIAAGFKFSLSERIDKVCGDFDDGRFGWLRGTYWVFPQPIPYRGRQALFDVPLDVIADQVAAAREVIGA
ncbi:MAG: ASCH domain-containing protein [Bradyrhizobium sp.]|uniref:ASCH domain-containing protein n=1 Tax=Bradyrhizobium sp. TaxID=376 RepID=UPI00272FD4E5|nr:ASCH domain-containing protein [Bradyrhizobium sp.]MDP1866979.1 ASCH domain-containing protein [Bradyrhizobium sp.]